MKPQSAKAKDRWKGKYRQAKSAEDYLNQRLDKSGVCWTWLAGVDKNGYGQCQSAKHAKELKVTRSHQLAFVVWNGKIPKGKIICHHCDNPTCCNPNHLYAGTWKNNVEDCIARGRYKNGAKKKFDHEKIVSLHGKYTCEKVAEQFNCSFSLVCQIWRKHGLVGRFYGDNTAK